MLSNYTFFETRIQQLLDSLFLFEKRFGVHVQRMLKISRFYTLADILSKIFVKNEGKLGTLFTIMVRQKLQCGANLIFIKICYAIMDCTTYTFTFRKC